MGIEVVDLVDMAHKEKRRKNIFDTPRFHAWMHYYQPGQKDAMHCHNADQTFVVLDGECTMSFPDGGKVTLNRGPGGADHRRLVLYAGKHRRWGDDHDGQSVGAGGEDSNHRLRHPEGRAPADSGRIQRRPELKFQRFRCSSRSKCLSPASATLMDRLEPLERLKRASTKFCKAFSDCRN